MPRPRSPSWQDRGRGNRQASLEDPYGHVHTDLVDQLDAVLDRLAAFEKSSRAGIGNETLNPASAERPPPDEADR